MKLFLHLGAHRTATTSFQSVMLQSKSILADNGILLLTPWQLGSREDKGLRNTTRKVNRAATRNGLNYFIKIRSARKEFRNSISGSTAETLIVSDENFLGNPFSYEGGSAIYPDVERNLNATAKTLQCCPNRVHLTIRDYSTFIVSVYAMQAIYRPGAPSFESIKGSLLRLEHSWLTVLRSMRKAFPDADISFSRYERDPIKSVITAFSVQDLVPSQLLGDIPRANKAPTEEAVMEALASKQRSTKDADELIGKFMSGKPFDPISIEEKQMLSEKYLDDLYNIGLEFREIHIPAGSKDFEI